MNVTNFLRNHSTIVATVEFLNFRKAMCEEYGKFVSASVVRETASQTVLILCSQRHIIINVLTRVT